MKFNLDLLSIFVGFCIGLFFEIFRRTDRYREKVYNQILTAVQEISLDTSELIRSTKKLCSEGCEGLIYDQQTGSYIKAKEYDEQEVLDIKADVINDLASLHRSYGKNIYFLPWSIGKHIRAIIVTSDQLLRETFPISIEVRQEYYRKYYESEKEHITLGREGVGLEFLTENLPYLLLPIHKRVGRLFEKYRKSHEGSNLESFITHQR